MNTTTTRGPIRHPVSAIAAIAAISLAPLGCNTASAAWPERPVKLVVAAAAGGPTDDLARVLANGLSEALGTSFFVENRGGGGGRIGNGAVARAEPDGYTLLVSAPTLTISFAMSPAQTPYDPEKDFAPIALLATAPAALSVLPKLGVKDLAGLIALSKQSADGLSYASAGTATVSNLSAELLKIRSGLRMAHVAHTGSGPAIQSLLSGAVHALATPAPAVATQVEAGTMIALAVSGSRRWRALPAAPTLEELGHKGLVVEANFGLLAPAATPADVTAKLAASTVALLTKPETRTRLEKLGYETASDVEQMGPKAWAARIASDLALWRDAVKQAGLAGK